MTVEDKKLEAVLGDVATAMVDVIINIIKVAREHPDQSVDEMTEGLKEALADQLRPVILDVKVKFDAGIDELLEALAKGFGHAAIMTGAEIAEELRRLKTGFALPA